MYVSTFEHWKYYINSLHYYMTMRRHVAKPHNKTNPIYPVRLKSLTIIETE